MSVVEGEETTSFRTQAVKVVGAFYAFLTVAGRFTPRAVLRRMMGRVMRPTLTPASGSRGEPAT
jgi:hypothetical protein